MSEVVFLTALLLNKHQQFTGLMSCRENQLVTNFWKWTLSLVFRRNLLSFMHHTLVLFYGKDCAWLENKNQHFGLLKISIAQKSIFSSSSPNIAFATHIKLNTNALARGVLIINVILLIVGIHRKDENIHFKWWRGKIPSKLRWFSTNRYELALNDIC